MRSFVPAYELVAPRSLAAALSIIGEEWRPFAGGTDLMVLFEAGKLAHRKWVSIRGLPELRGIEVSTDHVSLGSLTTYTEVQRHVAARCHHAHVLFAQPLRQPHLEQYVAAADQRRVVRQRSEFNAVWSGAGAEHGERRGCDAAGDGESKNRERSVRAGTISHEASPARDGKRMLRSEDSAVKDCAPMDRRQCLVEPLRIRAFSAAIQRFTCSRYSAVRSG